LYVKYAAETGYKFQALTPTVDAGTAGAGTIDVDTEGNKLTFNLILCDQSFQCGRRQWLFQ